MATIGVVGWIGTQGMAGAPRTVAAPSPSRGGRDRRPTDGAVAKAQATAPARPMRAIEVHDYLAAHRQIPSPDQYRPVAATRAGAGSMSFAAGRWLPALALGFAAAPHAGPAGRPARLAAARRQRGAHRLVLRHLRPHQRRAHLHGAHRPTSIIDGEEHERIEPLDGPPHEIVRRNDEMFCYFPDAKTVRLDRRVTARFFPSIFRGAPEAIAAELRR